MPERPDIICLNETLVHNDADLDMQLPQYGLIVRHAEQPTYRGIAVFAHKKIELDVTLLLKSASAERAWLLLHTDIGPYLLCCWYRRPNYGETDTITSFREEYAQFKDLVMGTIVVGDLNVHYSN